MAETKSNAAAGSDKADAAKAKATINVGVVPKIDRDASAQHSAAAKILADKFRVSTQVERLADPKLNNAAKVLAVANGHVDVAYKRGTPQNIKARDMMLEVIAKNIENGRTFTAPKIAKREAVKSIEREKVAEKDRSR